MPLAYPLRSLVEVDVFRGSLASAQAFGIIQVQSRSRDDATTWGDIPFETFWEDQSGRRAEAGDAYERQSFPQPDGTLTVGPWKYVGDSRSLEGQYGRAANIDWTPPIEPGGVMRTPLGTVLFDDAGDLLLRPAVGEQDLDVWTGEPLVDELGDPVLVPAE